MNPSFWKDKSVFVTGHTGFKGGWLSLWLQRLGARVTGFSLDPPSEPSFFEQVGVANGMESIRGDIRDPEALAGALAQTKPEIVLHLAAQALVRQGYRAPIDTYSTNVIGTATVFEALRSHPEVRAVVSVTSDKCYRNQEWQWGYRESDPLGGKDPYSSSKAAAELVTAAYRNSFFARSGSKTAVATARAGNVIGGGDWADDRLLPDLLRGFIHGRTVAIRSPMAIRPWQHVLEPLRGYLMLAERLWSGEQGFASSWNFGPEPRDERPVEWIADRLASLWGGNASWCRDSREHPPEATFLKLDTSKAAVLLEWRPVMHLETALRWIVDWHKAALAGEDLRRLSESQIDAYRDLLSEH